MSKSLLFIILFLLLFICLFKEDKFFYYIIKLRFVRCTVQFFLFRTNNRAVHNQIMNYNEV